MKTRLLYLSVTIFVGVLGLSWLSHGTGVIKDDAPLSPFDLPPWVDTGPGADQRVT